MLDFLDTSSMGVTKEKEKKLQVNSNSEFWCRGLREVEKN
jgi:hypothetical protein